jgi:heat shock protein HtpX
MARNPRGRKTVLESIQTNKRRAILGIAVFPAVIWLENLVFAFLLTGMVVFSRERMLGSLINACVLYLVIFPAIFLLAKPRVLFAFIKRFPEVAPSPLGLLKLRNACEGIFMAAGVKGVAVRVICLEGINAVSVIGLKGEPEILLSSSAVEQLSREELEALIAHEVYHLVSGDTKLWTLGFAIGVFVPTLFSYPASIIKSFAETPRDAKHIYATFKKNLAGMIALLYVWVLYLIAITWIPVWLTFHLLVLSGSHDFLADAHALMYTRNPDAVIGMLEKAQVSRTDHVKWFSIMTSHMFFLQSREPEGRWSQFISRLFDTHPSTEERIKNIKENAGTISPYRV